MEESTSYQYILSRGRKQSLLHQATKRFGLPSAEHTRRFNSTIDVSKLDTLDDRLLDVADWDEFLADV